MKSSIRETIREIVRLSVSQPPLIEADAYTRKFGKRFELYKEFEKFADVKSNDICEYAFTMTSVAKVGLNPRSEYDTPVGIYFYPLTSANLHDLMGDNLPFAGDLEYVSLVKLKDTFKWLNVQSRDVKYRSHLSKLYWKMIAKSIDEIVSSSPGWRKRTEYLLDPSRKEDFSDKSNEDLLHSLSKTKGKHWDMGDGARIFDYTYFASRFAKKPAVTWSKILSDFGFHGIYDDGNSVIHENEPSQLVAFRREYVEVIGTYRTQDLRKSSKEKNEELSDEAISRLIWRETSQQKFLNLYKKFKDVAGETTLYAFAYNPLTTQEMLEELSNSKSSYALQGVASNPEASGALLEKLASSEYAEVRLAVARNMSAPYEVLEYLSHDPSFQVSYEASFSLKKHNEFSEKQGRL
jgi:hypothetical protein